MKSVEITHVAVIAANIEESIEWYIDLFGDEAVQRAPTPKLVGPSAWLKLGSLSLHITEWPHRNPFRRNHFGVGVTDVNLFTSIYKKAKARGLFDYDTFGSHNYIVPGGEVQLNLQDPAGNLVEVDFPDVNQLDRSIFDDLVMMSELFKPQPADAVDATLFPWLRQPA